MIRTWAAMLIACALAACGPNLKDLERGETGVVSEVIDGDTLALDNGLKVQLTGIIAPRRGYGDRAEEPFAREARAGLEKLALGRPARLAYGGTKRLGGEEGREELALAQVFVRTEGGRWIWAQEAMLRQGFARARTWKDNHARSAALYAAEARARADGAGLWAEKAYAVRDAEPAPALDGFHIVEGVVRSIATQGTRTYLNFGADYRGDFTIAVNEPDLAAWTAKDAPLSSLESKRVRVRGYVRERGGPLLFVDHPQAIEVLN